MHLDYHYLQFRFNVKKKKTILDSKKQYLDII